MILHPAQEKMFHELARHDDVFLEGSMLGHIDEIPSLEGDVVDPQKYGQMLQENENFKTSLYAVFAFVPQNNDYQSREKVLR